MERNLIRTFNSREEHILIFPEREEIRIQKFICIADNYILKASIHLEFPVQ